MARFRKKPVVIEAAQTSVLIECMSRGFDHMESGSLPAWLVEAVASGVVFIDGDDNVIVKTLEGNHLAGYHDWILQGIKGELYPCKPDIFDLTYEPVDPPIIVYGDAFADDSPRNRQRVAKALISK